MYECVRECVFIMVVRRVEFKRDLVFLEKVFLAEGVFWVEAGGLAIVVGVGNIRGIGLGGGRVGVV